ncbi:MAG TPA: putative Ig domain-containing protein [Verrucomicrobiae bacterium]
MKSRRPNFFVLGERSLSKIEVFLLAVCILHAIRAPCADVVIDSHQTFQTIAGWGHGGGILGATEGPDTMLDPAIAQSVNFQYLDYLADDLGLTGSRTTEVGPRIDGTGTDDGDCDVVDWNLFESDTFSAADATNLLHYQNHILAEGFQPSFYSSTGYPTDASALKPWVMNHPGERAQQIWASALYLKTNFGINISYSVIFNEPSMAYTILADDIKALGPRFITNGLATQVQYAEAVAPQTDWGYITPVQNDPDMWPWVGRISYHDYGTADPYRSFLRDYGGAKGLTTAQTEMANPTFDDLYNDLTLAGVSYWEVGYSGNVTLVPSAGLSSFTPSGTYFRLRQVIHYVRPGAMRIGCISSDPTLHVLAFATNGTVTTIIENTAATQTVNLSGLPPGAYGLSQSPSGASAFQELGVRTVGAGGTLTLTNVIGSSEVTTLYPYSAPNHPPTIMTWVSNPGYLAAPTNTATLSVTANDAELDPLTYRWSVSSQPSGANALLAAMTNATTAVSGLTIPGTYVFNISVSDPYNPTSRQLYLNVYATNPPPVLGQTGFRFAAPYGLVFGAPSGTTHAIVELPASSATLQVGISDLANSDFTGRGTWSLVSQPPGANAGVGSSTYIYVSIRANVTNMTVPGDYLFQVDITNPGHPDLTAQIICTVNNATSAPVISSITASPSSLTLPTSATQLSAVTSGSTNQPLRHWWAVTTTPPGAHPLFNHQGTTNTSVSNLVLPGTYTFTLRAFDDLHETTSNKTVTVRATPGAPVITSAATGSAIAGLPYTYILAASNNPTGLGVGVLPPGLSFNNGVISGNPSIVGSYNIQLSATNTSGTGYGNLALTVELPLPVFTSPLSADGLVNAAFNYTIQSANVPTIFGATGLPGGLTLNAATGAITGTPTNAGIYSVTITAANTTGTTTNNLNVVIYNGVAPLPVVTSPSGASGAVGLSFNYAITATNNPTGFFAIGLPSGLSFNPANGGITGAPLVAGVFNVTIRASNRGGTGSNNLVLNIAPEPAPQLGAAPAQNALELSFLALVTHHYSVEWNNNLNNTNWTDSISGLVGNGMTNTIIDPTTDLPERFYRLQVFTP